MTKSNEEKQLIADCLILALATIIAGATVVAITLKALEEVATCIQ